MTTIKDVAKKARVSVTTVSHVINGTRFVSDELSNRVLTAMEELNYRPNILARSLRGGESKTIGLIIPDISNAFFAEIARVIEDEGFSAGYNVILCNSDNDVEKEANYINLLLSKQVDGVIFISAGGKPSHLLEFQSHRTPIIIADRDVQNGNADTVLINNELGGYLATKYLISLGHRRIACVTGGSSFTPSSNRADGCKRAHQEAGLKIDSNLIATGNFRFDGGEKWMEHFLNIDSPPTAVFFCNDMMAIGAYKVLREGNVKVPEAISIIGFDDIPMASIISPSLTTIAQPIKAIGQVTVELLVSRIQNQDADEPYQQIELNPELIIRESCSPING